MIDVYARFSCDSEIILAACYQDGRMADIHIHCDICSVFTLLVYSCVFDGYTNNERRTYEERARLDNQRDKLSEAEYSKEVK